VNLTSLEKDVRFIFQSLRRAQPGPSRHDRHARGIPVVELAPPPRGRPGKPSENIGTMTWPFLPTWLAS